MRSERGYDDICFLTKELHVWPDFHGNRSPIADPNLRGMVSIKYFVLIKYDYLYTSTT